MIVWKLTLLFLIYNIKCTQYFALLSLFMQSLNIKSSHKMFSPGAWQLLKLSSTTKGTKEAEIANSRD